MVSNLPIPAFCEDNFGCKPLLNADNNADVLMCHRKVASRVYWCLANSNTRDDILVRAKSLRHSRDPAVKTVYINPDLSREDARLAYERRVERRASRQQTSGDDHPPLDPSAPSFLPAPSGTN